MYTTLGMIKRQCSIDTTFEDDDELLLWFYQVAEATVQRDLCINLEDLEDDNGNIPAPVVQAMLLYIGELYNSREVNAYGVTPVIVPMGYGYLLDLYRNYADTTSNKFFQEVLDSVINRLRIEDSTGKLVLDIDPSEYVGVKGKAIKRIEDQLMVDAGSLYAQKSIN